MCTDSDGIYIIVQGACKVANKADKQGSELAQLNVNQCFGDSKFLMEPSYSYFGDVIAAQPPQDPSDNKQLELLLQATPGSQLKDPGASPNSPVKSNLKRKEFANKDANNSSFTLRKSGGSTTTCLFISQDLLYLIPFYDLQKFKQVRMDSINIHNLRKSCYTRYKT